jgi:hypothetical protein
MQAPYLLKDLYIHFEPEVQTEQQMQLNPIAFRLYGRGDHPVLSPRINEKLQITVMCVQAPQGTGAFPAAAENILF